jgi:hypothetical protein
VALFDADDISLPLRLEKQVAFLEKHPRIAAVGSHIYIIDENSKRIASRKYRCSPREIREHMLIRSPFAQPSVMLRSSVLHTIGKYELAQGYDRARDYDLWLRIGNKYPLANIDEFLVSYRVSKQQGKTTHLKPTIKSTLQVKRKWLFKKKLFTWEALLVYILEFFLLLLPNAFILWLFKQVMYTKVRNDT